jgi:hypothetical protein
MSLSIKNNLYLIFNLNVFLNIAIKGFDGDFISGSVALLVDGLAGAYVDNFRVGKDFIILWRILIIKINHFLTEGRNVKKLN